MLDDFDYVLPDERIARYPSPQRDASRLLTLERSTGRIGHRVFSDIVDLFDPGDLLVVNDTRVFPARLLGKKPTGAPCEVLLLRPVPGAGDGRLWEALVRPGSKLKPGRRILVGPDLEVLILDGAPGGGRVVRLETKLSVEEALALYGQMPLPPYLGRGEEPMDRERYQTVYARVRGSVAAPTAGLHFTEEVLSRLEQLGVKRASIVLHVGMGTFRPVQTDDLDQHEMHREFYEVSAEAANAVAETKRAGGRVWAVGTTVVRTLETLARSDGSIRSGSGETDLFIRPGFAFGVVDRLITNFHLPRSTLLMLVGAFAGVDRMQEAYASALENGYRFYSYGDAMAVL